MSKIKIINCKTKDIIEIYLFTIFILNKNINISNIIVFGYLNI